jgi:hypothetical protein
MRATARHGALMSHAAPGALGLLLSAAVVFPWTRPGWLLLLDWIPGPALGASSAVRRLSADAAVGWPATLLVSALVGAVGPAASWLLIGVAIVVASVGIRACVGGPPRRWVPATMLYVVNPVVYERIFAGQLLYLLGYSVLPLIARSLLAILRRPGQRPVPMSGALAIVGATAISVHFVWIAAVIAVAVAVVGWSRRSTLWLVALATLVVLGTAHLTTALLSGPGPVSVTHADLAAYRTHGDPRFGLFINVIGLYGFWRTGEAALPKGVIAGWPLLLVAIVILVVVGVRAMLERQNDRKAAFAFVVIGGAGYFLALGDQGPTGPVFRLAFGAVPGFVVMREPQKFIALFALALAVFFGFGAERLTESIKGRRLRVGATAVSLVMVVSYTPTLFWGLGGRVTPSQYPTSWGDVDDLLGTGAGRVLFLPWHQYLGLPFTGRVIANPAGNFLRRDTIIGDNVELRGVATTSTSPRSAYLEDLLSHGHELCAFGDLVTPLGVEYVLLYHAVDWTSYGWLAHQVDLVTVLERPDLTLYRNIRYRGIAYKTGPPQDVGGFSGLVTASSRGDVSRKALTGEQKGGVLGGGNCDSRVAQVEIEDVARRGITPRYRVAPDRSRAQPWLVLAEPFDASWYAGSTGGRPLRLATGTTALRISHTGDTVALRRWYSVAVGYLISGTAVGLMIIGDVIARHRRRASGRPRSGYESPAQRDPAV